MEERLYRSGLDVRLVRLQPWKVWLLAAVGVGLAVTLAIVVAGVFLILVPVLLIGGLIAKLVLGGARPPVARPRASGRPEVIEGHYEVVATDRHRARP